MTGRISSRGEMKMKVDVSHKNSALEKLIEDPSVTIFMDANLFIPPDRGGKGKPMSFDMFRNIWLDPLFSRLSGLSIHESVYDEFVQDDVKTYVDTKISAKTNPIKVHYNKNMNVTEQSLMQTYINMIAQHSQYIPSRDNKKDRGEVLSLAYMAAKGFIYFSANDYLPIRLIQEAGSLKTGLDNMRIIQMYEMIYYLLKHDAGDKQTLKQLYKYMYRRTEREKKDNPDWTEFVDGMDTLYNVQ